LIKGGTPLDWHVDVCDREGLALHHAGFPHTSMRVGREQLPDSPICEINFWFISGRRFPPPWSVKDAEQATIVRVLAPICADKFQHSADVAISRRAFRFGSKADIGSPLRHVRFAPKSGNPTAVAEYPLSVRTGVGPAIRLPSESETKRL
jgi:hypothetical protein